MTSIDSIIKFANLPLRDQMADRLADVLFGVDEILEMLRGEHAAGVRWMSPRLQNVYSEIDEIMKRLSN